MRNDKTTETEAELCNCRGRKKEKNGANVCPLNGLCLKSNVVYRADVESNGIKKIYVGSTGTTFKTRYAGHKASLKNKDHCNPTTLSTYYWQEKNKGNEPIIKWSIVKEIHGKYKNINGCPLCNMERLEIARSDKDKLLNKRNELMSSCPHHRNRFFPKYKTRKK